MGLRPSARQRVMHSLEDADVPRGARRPAVRLLDEERDYGAGKICRRKSREERDPDMARIDRCDAPSP